VKKTEVADLQVFRDFRYFRVFAFSASFCMNHAIAESYSLYCAKTLSVRLIETADDVFGPRYCGKSNRHGYCYLPVRENV